MPYPAPAPDIALDDYDAVVHSIYDAALQPDRWVGATRAIARLCGASHAMLFTWAHTPAQGGFLFEHGFPNEIIAQWNAKSLVHEDPFVREALRRDLMNEGDVILGDDLVPFDRLVETPFFRNIFQPSNIAGMCGGVVFDTTDAHKLPTAFSIHHGPQQPRFARQHVELVHRLVAHLSRALGVMFHLRDSQLQLASSRAALDRLSAGVLLLDGQRRIQYANPAALRVLQGGGALQFQSGLDASLHARLRLSPRLAAHEPALRQAIDGALASWATVRPERFAEPVVLPDETGRPQCVLHVGPLGVGAFGEAARAVVFVYDLATARALAPAALCELFDTTPAEARAALQVLQGGSAKTMAGRLGVSVNTFNSQLKAAYAKLGTHRQADLMKLLLALASH
ncbi:MAG: helix-turn-helix transcriptional regulator [Variovorax sp.]|nr:MAG: helix-turn-helix transcriptional regulator [Variovorax sp.]